ncbi:MAG: translocation/assembly module TamB domain-containing protein [Caulobacterales bacterium]|jgi:translocation and assembly module TamB|nr:translocation/assembly module TamB domain-containing protein [Caulobacterales bacterium]
MSDEPEPAKRKRRWWAYAAGGVFVASGFALAVGPGAAPMVDRLADGQRVWRLGHIEVDGVSGNWLGALRAERVAISDSEGVWLEAEDVALGWRPQDILFGDVNLSDARARTITILRQPTLLEKRPSSGASIDVVIADLRIDSLILHDALLGQAATFNASFALDYTSRSLNGLSLDLQRTDSDADRLVALYRPDEDYVLNFEAFGAPDGIFSRALGVPEQSVRATALGNGDAQAGDATFSVHLGETELLAGGARWTPTQWSADGHGQLDALPRLQTIARRIGARAAIQASGARVGAFEAHAETPFLAVDLNGELDEAHALVGPARIVATTERLSDVARESPFELGRARIEGQLRQARGTTAIQGTLTAERIEALGQTAALSGPVEAALTPEAFTLSGDLQTSARSGPLFANTRLSTRLNFDRARGRFELERAELTGDALQATAQGWTNRGDGEFAGEWRVRRLGAVSRDLQGAIGGRWRAFTDEVRAIKDWSVTLEGDGEGVGGAPEIVPQLLGRTPRIDARFRNENGGITVSHARIDGAQLRAGVTGRIVRGDANLALEASARGPLSLGGAEIAGVVDATGRITGRIARPTLAANASMSSFSAGGVLIKQPVLELTLAPNGGSYVGRGQVQGVTVGQPVAVAANVAIANDAIALTEIDGALAAMQAQGSASFGSRGVSADLAVNGMLDGLIPGVTGRMLGDVSLTPETLIVDAQVSDARAGELRVRAANFRAEGPFNAIAARFDMRGRLREAPLAFAGTATLDLEDASALSIEGRGTLAEAAIFTRAPIRAEWRDRSMLASLNVAVGDGVVQAQWEERGRALSGTAQIEDAPLMPLAAIWGERAEGRIDGRIALANEGGGLSGNADVTLDDARFAGRQRGRLDMHIVADLDPARLRANVDATSTEGLVAHFEADAPVVTSATPIRIALAPERRGQARWSVRGPAESLWAAARLQDQSLQGQLDGEGELSFGAGYLSGDGHIEIENGRFEDKLTGVTLVDLDARVAIDDRGVTIENFTAAGPHGGRLTATGGSANPREGRIAANVGEMRIVDRPDARATASGELTLQWEGLHSSLTGELNITEASVDIASNPEAGIPTIEVVEINRPGEEDYGEIDVAPRRNGSTELDVRIRAPGRVFTRGRGVDAEWSLDLRLDGTSRNPRLFGEARAMRGTLALSGQPFEIDDARIFFSGDPLDAQIDLTATRSTSDLTAYLRLTGTARDPEVSFTSDPGLPEDEILPQILFGRSVEDLSALEAAQLAASLAALSGNASLDLVDAARAAAGLDRFNVRQDENGGFLVAGGVYLTRDVYVEVARTGLGQAQSTVEWTIRPRLVLITSFLGNGDQRVSLRWRRESD